MSKIIIILDKYSDWLEAYSVIKTYPKYNLHYYYKDNDTRNDSNSINCIFSNIVSNSVEIQSFACGTTNEELWDKAKKSLLTLESGDIFCAPYIRFPAYWKLLKSIPDDITTINLSDSFPDSFGYWGFGLGFGLGFGFWFRLRQFIKVPFRALYAITHKPDICFYPLFPNMKNVFVKQTLPVILPVLTMNKRQQILQITNGEKRPLLIGGFKFNVEKMAKYLKIDKYIATSKLMEIIVDGVKVPLNERICAEEVLMSGCVSAVYGYPSTVFAWLKHYCPEVETKCFWCNGLDHRYGFYNRFAKQSLRKIGIEMEKEPQEILDEY
jgi:hypothetical protein